MSLDTKKILTLVCLLTLTVPLYAQNAVDGNKKTPPPPKVESLSENHLPETPVPVKGGLKSAFWDFINKEAYAAPIDKEQERTMLREKWKRLVGIDIFYPYYKAKEVENWVEEKGTVRIFKITGRPKFDDSQIKYIFKISF